MLELPLPLKLPPPLRPVPRRLPCAMPALPHGSVMVPAMHYTCKVMPHVNSLQSLQLSTLFSVSMSVRPLVNKVKQ